MAMPYHAAIYRCKATVSVYNFTVHAESMPHEDVTLRMPVKQLTNFFTIVVVIVIIFFRNYTF